MARERHEHKCVSITNGDEKDSRLAEQRDARKERADDVDGITKWA